MKAVSNSSVLIALSSIGQLELIHKRFPDGVIIPQAVWKEVVETGAGRVRAEQVAKASWLTISSVSNMNLLSLLRLELDEGESEAIALFIEQPNQAILLDEKNARRVAKQMNLPVLGTIGILIWAKQNGLIPNLKEQLDALQSIGNFRLSNLIYQEAITKVGEWVDK
jgi:predicted nucleic acid-binding protein